MSRPAHGSPVPLERSVARLLPRDFIPPDWDHRTHELVQPNSGDERAAARRGEAVRVSVWDLTLCTIPQAVRIHGKEKPAFIAVAAEAALAGGLDVAVVYDELDAPQCEQPGADGHAGIEGLARKQMEDRRLWRARLAEVASVFVPHR